MKSCFASLSVLALAAAVSFSPSAHAREGEFQCSSSYRIALPAPQANGVIQTSAIFDRMIFEGDGLWLHDDTNISFRLDGDAATLEVDGREIGCEKVAQAYVTTIAEPASARAAPLAADKAQVAAATPQGGAPKNARISKAATPLLDTAVADPNKPTVPPVEEQQASLPADVDAETTGSVELAPETSAQAAGAVLTGQSRGGRLRAGPGTDFAIAGALEAGTPITIIENVGNEFRGFDWFEIEYGDGQRAFTWGGILCSDGEKAIGVFEVCG
ncbi:MAG: SH3 domain-containing protein [Pseudomonadota bacterium]